MQAFETKLKYDGKTIQKYRDISQKKRMTQEGESLIGKLFIRHISIYITLFFHAIGLRNPNLISALMIIPGVLTGFFYWHNSWILGGLSYLAFVTIDACDGEMARITKRFSRFGVYVDGLALLVIPPAMMGGYYGGMWQLTSLSLFLGLGAVGILLKFWDYGCYLLSYYVRIKASKNEVEAKQKPRKLGYLRIFGYLFNFTFLSLFSILMGIFYKLGFQSLSREMMIGYAHLMVPGFAIWFLVRNFYAREWLDDDALVKNKMH